MELPDIIRSVDELEDVLSSPEPELVDTMRRLDGDILILGAGGKMGPTLARLAKRALEAAGSRYDVIAVARFSDPEIRRRLESWGIRTITADLLEENALAVLPDTPNVIYLAAYKFGATGNEPLCWAMNTWLPARVADRYRHARIVALSTGNVYPLMAPESGGPTEDTPPQPVGEYAQSCLGRERMFQYFSRLHATRVALIRLNYAIDLRYGVLLDLGQRVRDEQPVRLAMGHVNVIWQGEANSAILRCLEHAASPPMILNLTGPEILSIRELATELGGRLGVAPTFEGQEEPTALISNASRFIQLMGRPRVTPDRMLDWTTHWLRAGGPTLDKPTHFQTRDGKF
jgi:nucleoside-diphosphate-sugar epimerase